MVRSGWSTPMIWNHGSGEDLVILGSGRLCGYDPDTGEEKWFATGFSRETISVPVTGGGRLFASAAMLGGVADELPDREPFWTAMLAFDRNGDGQLDPGEAGGNFTFPLRPELPVEHPGFGIPLPSDPDKRKERQQGVFEGMDKDRNGFISRQELLDSLSFQRGKPLLLAIRPGGRGDITSSHVEWELRRSIPEIPSPLFHRDRIYLVRTGGLLSCVDAAGGDILYTERLGAPGQYSASPVLAGDHLYLVSNPGLLSVVKTGDTFTPVHRLDLEEPAMVTPAIDRDTLYLRTKTRLRAFRATE
jgi:outer membrane protein assembly factor BamB